VHDGSIYGGKELGFLRLRGTVVTLALHCRASKE
jgi:hypothetical protein